MTKSLKRLLYILGIVVLYAIYDFIPGSDSNTIKTNAVKEPSMIKPLVKNHKTNDLKKAGMQLNIKTNWQRDPFKRNRVKKVKKKTIVFRPSFEVNAITSNQGRYSAMINQKFVIPGKFIQGYKVLDIYQDKVKMLGPDGVFYLNMK